MREIFIKKVVSYDLRIRQLCRLPIVNSKKAVASSLAFRGSLLWNTLSDEIKDLNSIQKFRKEIPLVDGLKCSCHIFCTI